MFDFLQLRLRSAIVTCREIAYSARIEPVMDEYRLMGFIVELEREIEHLMPYTQAIAAFQETIDLRIEQCDFGDQYPHSKANGMNTRGAIRVVFSPTQCVKFIWHSREAASKKRFPNTRA